MAGGFTDVSSAGGYKPAAPTRKPPRRKPPRKPPATPPPSTGDPFGDLSAAAAARAKEQIDAEIAAITGQQSYLQGNAANEAKQLADAARAGAALIHGFGTPVSDAYQEAAKTLAQLAQGYTGQVRSDAATDAAAVQHDLDAVKGGQGAGSVPGPGTAPGQAAINHGDELGNFVYGTGAAQPATALGAAAAAAAARESAMPDTIIGYGQQLGLGTLGAARKAIEQLALQIPGIRAKLPGLESSILSDLANTQAKLTKSAQPRILGSAASGYYAFDPTTGKMTQILAADPRATRVQTFSSGGNEYAINPDGSVTQITHNPTKEGPLKVVKTANGQVVIDSHGRTVRTLPPAPSSTTTKGVLSPTATRTFVASLGKTVTLKNPDGSTQLNPDGTPRTKTTHRMRYMAAYNFLRRHGVSDVDARTQLSTSYERGQDGRAWLTNEEQAVLGRAQKAGAQPGFIGLQANKAALRGLLKVRKYQGLAYLTPIQYQVLNSARQLPAVHPGAPGGGYWIDPSG